VWPDRPQPDTPGWTVRVVPNLYPAFDRQEVVVHTPRHVRSLAELTTQEIASTAGAWASRAEAARAEGFGYMHAVINEGRLAGASLLHSHSQLVWLRESPPGSAQERTHKDACALCELLTHEIEARTLTLGSADEVVHALVHPAGRVPYELLIAPQAHEPEPWNSRLLEYALDLVAMAVRQLREAEGPVPFNAWLHTAPFGGDGHWHFEVVPRLTVFAGVELGAGIYVNPLPPEQAAQVLRQQVPQTFRQAAP
jgi:UDPglucose--hexose-1-phosphate uridylyltransferase